MNRTCNITWSSVSTLQSLNIYFCPFAPSPFAPMTTSTTTSTTTSVAYVYAVMDHCARDNGYGECSSNCQSSYIALPSGWELVPYSADLVTNVVRRSPTETSAYGWGTHCLVFSNGESYYTNSGIACGSGQLLTSGNSYKISSCCRKVLMRQPTGECNALVAHAIATVASCL